MKSISFFRHWKVIFKKLFTNSKEYILFPYGVLKQITCGGVTITIGDWPGDHAISPWHHHAISSWHHYEFTLKSSNNNNGMKVKSLLSDIFPVTLFYRWYYCWKFKLVFFGTSNLVKQLYYKITFSTPTLPKLLVGEKLSTDLRSGSKNPNIIPVRFMVRTVIHYTPRAVGFYTIHRSQIWYKTNWDLLSLSLAPFSLFTLYFL